MARRIGAAVALRSGTSASVVLPRAAATLRPCYAAVAVRSLDVISSRSIHTSTPVERPKGPRHGPGGSWEGFDWDGRKKHKHSHKHAGNGEFVPDFDAYNVPRVLRGPAGVALLGIGGLCFVMHPILTTVAAVGGYKLLTTGASGFAGPTPWASAPPGMGGWGLGMCKHWKATVDGVEGAAKVFRKLYKKMGEDGARQRSVMMATYGLLEERVVDSPQLREAIGSGLRLMAPDHVMNVQHDGDSRRITLAAPVAAANGAFARATVVSRLHAPPDTEEAAETTVANATIKQLTVALADGSVLDITSEGPVEVELDVSSAFHEEEHWGDHGHWHHHHRNGKHYSKHSWDSHDEDRSDGVIDVEWRARR